METLAVACEIWGAERVALALKRYELANLRIDVISLAQKQLEQGTGAVAAWSSTLPEPDLDILIAVWTGFAVDLAPDGPRESDPLFDLLTGQVCLLRQDKSGNWSPACDPASRLSIEPSDVTCPMCMELCLVAEPAE